jgi:hypothetical protein
MRPDCLRRLFRHGRVLEWNAQGPLDECWRKFSGGFKIVACTHVYAVLPVANDHMNDPVAASNACSDREVVCVVASRGISYIEGVVLTADVDCSGSG